MATVTLRGVTKRFGAVEVVGGVDVAAADGEFVVLVGPSGCGKSTLLRMIAGLEAITAGTLEIGGRPANALPPQRRNVAMVFQSYALYPHMTARDNIAYGPRIRGEPAAEVAAKVERAARALNLFDYLDRMPKELSGGQRQRVAMGRALVREPEVFLFDEPLSNLDAKLRVAMRAEIKALHRRVGTTSIYVTHDQIEAMTMADRIVVMNGGRVEQEGRPLELYDRPANRFVAGFLGTPAMTFLDGRLTRAGNRLAVTVSEGVALPLRGEPDLPEGAEVVAGVRPESFAIAADGLPAEVELVEATGAETLVAGRVAGQPFTLVAHRRLDLAPGATARLAVAPGAIHLFAKTDGRRQDLRPITPTSPQRRGATTSVEPPPG